MIKIKKSPLLLTLYNGIYALIILVYIFVSCIVLLYNSLSNEKTSNKKVSSNGIGNNGIGNNGIGNNGIGNNGIGNNGIVNNDKKNKNKNYIYGNNKKLFIMFIINFIVGLSLVIKGIIFMKAQCSEKDYYRNLKKCIGFNK